MFKSYDTYNLRARISTGIILLAPVLFPIYLLIPAFRELSTTIITLIVCFALCNIIISCSRLFGEKAKAKCFPEIYPAQRMLLSSDTSLDSQTKNRYQQFLIRNLNGISFTGNAEELAAASNTAINWLISRTRDSKQFSLIHEENINFGFACNLYGLKALGITICVIVAAAESIALYFSVFGNPPAFTFINILISLFIALSFLAMWFFLITKRWVQEAGEKYGLALLSACDSEHLNAS